MKKLLLKPHLIALVGLLTILGCSKDEISEEKLEMIQTESPLIPEHGALVKIKAHKDQTGKIDGYFYTDQPSEIFAIGQTTGKISSQVLASSDIISLIGDQDNFGYGGTSNPPCEYFDLSEPEDDIGGFDRLHANTNAVRSWTHDFTNNPNYCSNRTVGEVTIKIHEKFNRGLTTITIDGMEVEFVQEGGISACKGKTAIQTYIFSGDAASFAQDGIINITVKENGGDVALDYSLVTVKYSTPSSTIIIDNCDTGVTNQTVGCGNMSDVIEVSIGSFENHGDFVKYVSELTNTWKKNALISGEDKDKIMSCAAGARVP